MEQMRSEFEVWCSCRPGSILNIGDDDEYKSRETQIMWEAWQASRHAIEIEMPDLEKWRSPDSVRAQSGYRTLIKNKLIAAGLRIKGD